MTQYTISQYYKPSHEEMERWRREEAQFNYQPPDGNAPSRSALARGWGVHPGHRPPIDAFDYVAAMLKRDVAEQPVDAQLHPEFRWSVLSVCMAHFLWLRTPAGATWMLAFFGIEEVTPFHEGYAYTYLNPDAIVNGEPSRVPLDRDGGFRLRIFRSCENTLTPPIPVEHSPVIREMCSLLRDVRNPNAKEMLSESSPDMYHWVSERIRDWFLEPHANPHWPTHKADRTTGGKWARSLERAPGVPFYEALRQVEKHGRRAYRIEDSQGNVKWCGGDHIRFMTRPDHHRVHETLSEHQIQNVFVCSSCGNLRPCTPVTKTQRMCCSCFGGLVESGERPTLARCTMAECVSCKEHLENRADLVNLKHRLNREVKFPVSR